MVGEMATSVCNKLCEGNKQVMRVRWEGAASGGCNGFSEEVTSDFRAKW